MCKDLELKIQQLEEELAFKNTMLAGLRDNLSITNSEFDGLHRDIKRKDRMLDRVDAHLKILSNEIENVTDERDSLLQINEDLHTKIEALQKVLKNQNNIIHLAK